MAPSPSLAPSCPFCPTPGAQLLQAGSNTVEVHSSLSEEFIISLVKKASVIRAGPLNLIPSVGLVSCTGDFPTPGSALEEVNL